MEGRQGGDDSPWSSRALAGGSGVALLVAVAGCSGAQQVVGTPEYTWLWLIAPLIFYSVVGGSALYAIRVRQLKNWDLRTSPSVPTKRSMLWTLAIAAAAFWLIWILCNFLIFDIDPRQKWQNSGLALVGTVLGVLLAALGPFVAERPYIKQEDS